MIIYNKKGGNNMELTTEQFRILYETTSNREIAKKLGVTPQTITGTARRLGIKLKGHGNRKRAFKIIKE